MKLKRLIKKRKNRYPGICHVCGKGVPAGCGCFEVIYTEEKTKINRQHFNKLEHCPFCGGTSLTIDYDIDEGGWYISCDNIRCNCSILQDTEEEAIRAWNRRAKDECND